MFLLLSLSKNNTIEAMSSLLTNVCKDTIDSNCFLIFSGLELFNIAFEFTTLFILSPSTDPGQIALTLILYFPNSIAKVFVNPIIDSDMAEKLRKKSPKIPLVNFNRNFKVSAAWLIEACGFRGARFKNVGMHLKHSLVLVNYNESSSQEILVFADRVKASVKEKFAIDLEIEPKILSSSGKSMNFR